MRCRQARINPHPVSGPLLLAQQKHRDLQLAPPLRRHASVARTTLIQTHIHT